MNADFVRLIFVYSIAAFVTVAGMVEIFLLINAGKISGEAGLATITILIGGAVQYVFNREASTQGARQSERSMQQGADTALATPTTVTVQDGKTS